VNQAEFLWRHAKPGTEYSMEVCIVIEAGGFRDLFQGHWTKNNPFSGHIKPYIERILHNAFAKRFFKKMHPS
jgi:hypothetical protein